MTRSLSDGHESTTKVGIALVVRGGRVLVRQRPDGAPLAGLWEFPGGKCEDGEAADAAAERECREETGLDVTAGRLRRVVGHRYPHGRVELYYYDCVTRDPIAQPAAGTGFAWVEVSGLASLVFPDGNRPILDDLVHEFSAT